MNSQDYFNDELLEKRVDKFYGYGNYQGNYWFIGMEEAGGDFKENNNRINVWSNRGELELEDLVEYHIAIGARGLFQLGAAIQPTWNKLIRIVLSAKGIKNINTEDVRKYQIYELGRANQETCLLELLPLPSPSLADWTYSQHSLIPFLSNRNDYENHCVEKRINYISNKIKECQPSSVVFYGIRYEYSWIKIADVEFLPTSEGFLIGRSNQTVFTIVKHPTAFGVTNEYFHNIGKSIAASP
ncbi:hypothetical protein DSM106972_032500 [Dulcicalothrix desertica PCC 7102]|uniref:Uncharacterized protein n=1 Tax=Dulcicalothrix desertica PCC 7102 TaxID=232991 RepID=A0A433VIV4_9CYAN|nr:hypothetical protein [Dulcicalothrix desertica]RUT06044.1 hypothetical protein DSM106972_032500 [Dulcicalothrix desertica PCC 7102]TWH54289.1 hypothetical protein CAL7102_02308 [Dulcicalothrix desertica PCC 7102]